MSSRNKMKVTAKPKGRKDKNGIKDFFLYVNNKPLRAWGTHWQIRAHTAKEAVSIYRAIERIK